MYQNYPNFYQPPSSQARQQQQIPMQQPIIPSVLKGRLVSSIDEVRATPIDFDGSVFFFPDVANKKIYTKQINLDGTASLNMYELKDMPIPQISSNGAYITRDEFESTISKLQSSLEQMQGIGISKANNITQVAPSTNEKTFDF